MDEQSRRPPSDELLAEEPAAPSPPADSPPADTWSGQPAVSADDLAAGAGHTTRFEQAVTDHTPRLLTIARAIVGFRASPEDVVQQAVMNLYRHRARYDWRHPGGLLKRAVVNESLRLLRPPRMSMVGDDVQARPDAPDASIQKDETVRKVREAIDKLPEHFRAALVLCEYEGMSYADIARTLDASIPQVKTWLHRARRRLAVMLEPYVTDRGREPLR